MYSSALFRAPLWATLASAGVVVTKTGQAPTGYEVQFTYFNDTATQVTIAGGLQTFTDEFHVSAQASANYDPKNYKSGWFRSLGLATDTPYNMTSDGQGNWQYTTPLPSGTYQYAFEVDCYNVTECTLSTGRGSVLPGNDQDAQLHVARVYSPSGRCTRLHTLPAIRLWRRCRKRVSPPIPVIGHIEPTVVVMPSFYNLAPEYAFQYGYSTNGQTPTSAYIRENYMEYLFPWVEEHYNVTTDPAHRAFAGLSLGSLLTYEMYINATDYFSYFGMFSGVLGPGTPADQYINASMVEAKPSYLERGIYTGVGLFDIAFEDVRNLQAAFDTARVPYVGRVVPFGFHYWNTWADCLWNFGHQALWKPLPFAPTDTVSFPF
ncbi:hypothetical protein PFICI_04928 [Pestalotiopsis fici W106-1]|uniref:Uncharacterized protein n=1 Tax=Pestalotiopsis fici (strain W106-1 / CGMCC3.15140) TaxID=1229662 RepID=W3XC81_PESFW|nr:uncharacterized protein PFICI_04928 [Pestalotiopsis fici W106-1]ETS83052.1 hypothetical protein PFICI_04928 [Pestalotiopsis fici W106-1]